jgi:uncharacterized protein (TIGR02598 family)
VGLIAHGLSCSFIGMQRTQSATCGFTLVEVVVAMSIFTMVIAGGLVGVSRGFDLIEDSRHHTRISQILQSEIESMRTLSWNEMSSLPASAEIAVETQFDTSTYDAYTVTRTIITEEADRKRVEVSVAYTNKRGKLVSLKYLTFFTQGGVNDYYYSTI